MHHLILVQINFRVYRVCSRRFRRQCFDKKEFYRDTVERVRTMHRKDFAAECIPDKYGVPCRNLHELAYDKHPAGWCCIRGLYLFSDLKI